MFQSKTVLRVVFYFMLGLSHFLEAYKLEAFIARTWDEMEKNGWTATGAYPLSSSFPSDWDNYLKPLDTSLTGGGVWMFNAVNGRVALSFDKFTGDDIEFCEIESVKVYIKYFADNATMRVSPCIGVNCNLDPGDNVEWQRSSEGSTVEVDLLTDTKLQVEIFMLPGGIVVFDQITIVYVGEKCDATTETSQSSTDASEMTTTEESVLSTSETPPICECCNTCSSVTKQYLIAQTFANLTTVGWRVAGPASNKYGRPSDWSMDLAALDTNVTGGSVWMYEETIIPATYSFNKFTEEDAFYCQPESVIVNVTYYSNNAVMYVSPCAEGSNCYLDSNSDDGIWWNQVKVGLDIESLKQSEIKIGFHVMDPGFLFFDQIILSFYGTDCSVATQETEIFEAYPGTTMSGELKTTTPLCDCCNSCPDNDNHYVYRYNI